MAQPPNRGFDPNKLNGLTDRLVKIPTLGKPSWGVLIDKLKAAADADDPAALDAVLDNLGTAYALITALSTTLRGVIGSLTAAEIAINSLENRVRALERH